MGFNPELQEWFNKFKSINVLYHINNLKNKNPVIISMDTEEELDKIQHLFRIKTNQNKT